jgi:Lrp/AsnC family transcriptional regulator for asnA, asnC and gidA
MANDTLDTLDIELIELLVKDAHISSTALANRLHVNSSTIRRRMKNLIKQGIIRITATPDFAKIGLPVMAILSFEVSHEKVDSVLKELNTYPNVAWLGATSGRFNVRSVWWTSSTDELHRLTESEIGKIDGILRIETSICLRIVKDDPTHLLKEP